MEGNSVPQTTREGNTSEANNDNMPHRQLEYKDQVGPSVTERQQLQQQQQQSLVNRNTALIQPQANIVLIEGSDDGVLNIDNLTIDTDPTHQHTVIARDYPMVSLLEQQESNPGGSADGSTITTTAMTSTISGLTTAVGTADSSSIPIANQVLVVVESEQERRLLQKIDRLTGALLRTGIPLDTVEEMLNDTDDGVSREETSTVCERVSQQQAFTLPAAAASTGMLEHDTSINDPPRQREQQLQLLAFETQEDAKRERKWWRSYWFWFGSVWLLAILSWIEFPFRWNYPPFATRAQPSLSSSPTISGEDNLSCEADNPTSTANDASMNQRDRAIRVLQYLQEETLTGTTLQYDTASTDASDQALTWLIDTDPLLLTVEDNDTHLLQRFALLTFVFAQGSGAVLQGSSTPPMHECDGTHLHLEAPLWVCDDDGIVREITSGSIGLWGTLPADLGLLTHVSVLDFSKNRLEGTIPTTIGLLTALRVLDVQGNRLEGAIPTALSLLKDLEFLRLNDNQLSGTIPSIMWGRQLQMLRLSQNRLQGTVPAVLGMLTDLDILWLQGNQLTGTLPATLTGLAPRDALFFDNPGLSGRIPFCDSAMHPKTTLIADCHRVDCPCCSYCCPDSKDGIPSTSLCHN